MAEEQGEKQGMAGWPTEAQEALKRLQRELQKSRDRNAKLMEAQLHTEETKAEVTELRDLLDTLVEGGRLGDAEDEGEQLKPFKEGKTKRRGAEVPRREILDLLSEHDLDWSDPSLADAKKLYDSGDFVKAAETVKRVVGGAPPDAIEAAVAAALQKHGIKSVAGEGSAAPSGIPTDPAVLREKMRDLDWYRAHKTEILAGVRAGTIK